MLGILLIAVAVVCAFTFPSFLIDAIKEDDPETAKIARRMACGTFGGMILSLGIILFAIIW